MFKLFRAVPQMPNYETVDGGSGGGSGTGAPNTGGSSAATVPTGGGGQAAQPVSLSDDAPFTYGGKTYGSFKEYQQGFVPRSEHEAVSGKFKSFQDNLRNLATNLKRQPQQPQQRVDPFAEIRNLPIVDGATLSKLAENGFGQVAQQLQQQQNAVAAMAKKLGALEQGYGGVQERNARGDFEKRLDTVIGGLGEDFDPKNETLRELAQDVYHSFDWKGDEVEKEFPKIFAKRVNDFIKLARTLDQTKLKKAKEHRFVRPGGSASPSGPSRARLSNSDVADMVFGKDNAST